MTQTADLALHYLALALVAAAAVLAWLPGRKPRLPLWAPLAAGVAVLSVEAALRWAVTGHLPLFGTWENTLTSAAVVAGLAAVRLRRLPSGEIPVWARLMASWPAVTLLYGSFFRSLMLPLTISERSLWVEVHVFFAWAAYALLLEAAMRALGAILGDPADAADPFVLRGVALGFVAFSLMLAVGSWYSYNLFSQWYQWELVETLAAAMWLGYGIVLHARLMLGWRGMRLYWAVMACLPLLLLSFWVWSVYSGTYHFFDIRIFHAG